MTRMIFLQLLCQWCHYDTEMSVLIAHFHLFVKTNKRRKESINEQMNECEGVATILILIISISQVVKN